MLDAIDAGPRIGAVGSFDGIQGNGGIAVAVNLYRPARRLHRGNHRLQHISRIVGRAFLVGSQIGDSLRAGLRLIGAVANDLDAEQRETRVGEQRRIGAAAEVFVGIARFHVVVLEACAQPACSAGRQLDETLDPSGRTVACVVVLPSAALILK